MLSRSGRFWKNSVQC